MAKNVIFHRRGSMKKKHDSNGEKDKTETVAGMWLVRGSEESGQ